MLPLRIRQDLSKSQVFYLTLCRATASDTVFWVLSLQSLAPLNSLPSSFHIPWRVVAPSTLAWDLKRKAELHHAQKVPASHKSHLQAVASKVSFHPSSSLLLGYLSPNIGSSGARGKFRDEPELCSRNRQQQPSFNTSCTDCPWFGPYSRKAGSPPPSCAFSLRRRDFTCAMNGVMRAPTLAIPLHVPRPKARVAVG